MDHIPEVGSPAFPPLEVPYLYSDRHRYIYDKDEWLTYPNRNGWNFNDPETGDFLRLPVDFLRGGEVTPYESASFLQAWLFFGVIYETLGDPIRDMVDFADYIRLNEQGRQVITTEELRGQIASWWYGITYLISTDQNAASVALERMSRCITTTELFISKCLINGCKYYDKCPLPHEVALSIMALCDTLIEAKREFMRHSTDEHRARRNPLVVSRLHELNWCPSEIQWLHNRFHTSAAYFASMLNRRPLYPERSIWRWLTSIFGCLHYLEDHSKCTDDECRLVQIDENTYQTEHIPECKGCQFLSVPSDTASRILQEGGIPLVRLRARSGVPDLVRDVMGGGAELQVVHGSPDADLYVAFSHVWADGLGNCRENALPLCQLIYLQLAASFIPNRGREGHVLFWIDSLCVPTIKGDAKKLAISRMHQTYSSAEAVIVLDKELRYQSSCTSKTEIFMRIFLSRWMRRLWTLQEGAMSRNLFVMFQEGLFNVRYEFQEWRPSHEREIVKNEIAGQFLTHSGIHPPEGMEENVTYILMNMDGRIASHPQDEIICLATMLGFTEEQMMVLLHTPPERRMQRFVETQKVFPADIIYLGSPVLSDDGYRWIPRSLNKASTMRVQESYLGYQKPLVRKEAAGLMVTAFGFRIFAQEITDPDTFLIKDVNDNLVYGVFAESGTYFDRDSLNIHNPALIVQHQPEYGKNARGVLVEELHLTKRKTPFIVPHLLQTLTGWNCRPFLSKNLSTMPPPYSLSFSPAHVRQKWKAIGEPKVAYVRLIQPVSVVIQHDIADRNFNSEVCPMLGPFSFMSCIGLGVEQKWCIV